MAFLPVLSSPACSGFPGSWFVFGRNEVSCVYLSLFGLFLLLVTALGVLGQSVGRFPLMRDQPISLVLRTFSFWMRFAPLSVTPLCARLLWGGFLVFLAVDESLRLSLALSSVLPCNMFWLHVYLHGTGSGP